MKIFIRFAILRSRRRSKINKKFGNNIMRAESVITRSRCKAKSCPPLQRPLIYGPLATIPDQGFLVSPDLPLRGFSKRKRISVSASSSDSLGTAESSPDDEGDPSITPLLSKNANEPSCETQDDAQSSAEDVGIATEVPVATAFEGEDETTGGIAACPSPRHPFESNLSSQR
jgi:hypothetical protein